MSRGGRNNKASKKNRSRETQNEDNRPRVSGRGIEDPEIRHNQRIVRSTKQRALDSIHTALLRSIAADLEEVRNNDESTVHAIQIVYIQLRKIQKQLRETQRQYILQAVAIMTVGIIVVLLVAAIITRK